MTIYFIDDVSEGMLLNVDLFDDANNALFIKGQFLTSEILYEIKKLGYLTLDVVINESKASLQTQHKLITTDEMLSPKIDKIFLKYEANPLMMKIKEIAFESIRKFTQLQQHEA